MSKRKQADAFQLSQSLQRAPAKARKTTIKIQPSRLKECIICTESLPKNDFPALDTAFHDHLSTTCRECWKTHLKGEIERKAGSGVKCPECSERLEESEIKRLATKDTYGLYLDKLFAESMQSDPNWRTCPSSTCSYGYILTQNDNQSDSIFNCRVCEAQYCIRCEVPMHKGESCKTYQKRTQQEETKRKDEKASTEFLSTYAKKCPKCTVQIRKDGGCDHMTCRRCHHEFCWQCLVPYAGANGIMGTKGNRAHKETCRYHPHRLPNAPRDLLGEESESDGEDDWLFTRPRPRLPATRRQRRR